MLLILAFIYCYTYKYNRVSYVYLVSWNLAELTYSVSCVVEFWGFSTQMIRSCANKDNLILSFSISKSFGSLYSCFSVCVLFCCLALANSSESGHSCLVPSLRRQALLSPA